MPLKKKRPRVEAAKSKCGKNGEEGDEDLAEGAKALEDKVGSFCPYSATFLIWLNRDNDVKYLNCMPISIEKVRNLCLIQKPIFAKLTRVPR